MVNSPLIRPYLYLLGGVALGGTLDSHETNTTHSREKHLKLRAHQLHRPLKNSWKHDVPSSFGQKLGPLFRGCKMLFSSGEHYKWPKKRHWSCGTNFVNFFHRGFCWKNLIFWSHWWLWHNALGRKANPYSAKGPGNRSLNFILRFKHIYFLKV